MTVTKHQVKKLFLVTFVSLQKLPAGGIKLLNLICDRIKKFQKNR
jgi:hypothetical protein